MPTLQVRDESCIDRADIARSRKTQLINQLEEQGKIEIVQAA